jgi:hypothetical protein
MHARLAARLLTAKVLERSSGADYVTLRLFLLTVSAQDIAIEAGNSFDASSSPTIDAVLQVTAYRDGRAWPGVAC